MLISEEAPFSGVVEKVIYSSGTSAVASNTGTIDSVDAGIAYDIKAAHDFFLSVDVLCH